MWKPSRRQLLASSSALVAARATFAEGLSGIPQGTKPRLKASDYLLAPEVTYLNHAAIGTIPRLIHEAHLSYLTACETNPTLYVWGDVWKEAVGRAHDLAAGVLGVEPGQAAIIRNATAAFGMAANGLPIGAGDEVLFSSLNHVGASASWRDGASARGFSVRQFSFPESEVASMTPADVTAVHLDAIREETDILVLPHVDNVYGIRHDVRAIAEGARKRGVRWIIVDGAQSVGMHPVRVGELGVDLYATSAHKWLEAPKGTGLMALSAKAIEAMRPLVTSWGQKSWHGTARAFTDFGTRDIPKMLTVGDAIELYGKSSAGREERFDELRQALAERVAGDERMEWRSPPEYHGSGASIAAVGLRRGSARSIAKALAEEEGIMVRGFEDGTRNHLRVSPGAAETTSDIERFWKALSAKLG